METIELDRTTLGVSERVIEQAGGKTVGDFTSRDSSHSVKVLETGGGDLVVHMVERMGEKWKITRVYPTSLEGKLMEPLHGTPS